MKRPFVIGIDFGTLSARAIMVDARNGCTVASAIFEYPDGSIEETLPGSSIRLKPRTALQNPADYLRALEVVVPALLRKSKIPASGIAAVGTDFTSCTVLPVKSDGTPLCFDQRFVGNPHAWPKLWKHHAAQPEADHINRVGARRKECFLQTYGGKYSSEWFFSKVLETLREAPGVYHAASYFIEACDWIVWQLTGKPSRNVSAAGFKGMRVCKDPSGSGEWTYPSASFFKALDPDLKSVIAEKMAGSVVHLGSAVGGLTPAMARRMHLEPGIPVCAGNIDAHAGVPACGVTQPGSMVMIMGTSTCHLLIAESEQPVEGICGVVQDGVVPGAWGYEAGQAGVGDLFAWHAASAPAAVVKAAARERISVHEWLSRECATLAPGQSGLLALDWWNGNRSVLVNADLTGVILGLSLRSTSAEIYRALMEATAFGTRVILDAFASKGLPMKELVASGGLAQKNPVLMQIYADVLQQPVAVASSEQSSAFGAAMWAAVAAGLHRDIHAAAAHMTSPKDRRTYRPQREYGKTYDRLYEEYLKLHDYFGRTSNGTMQALRELQRESLAAFPQT